MKYEKLKYEFLLNETGKLLDLLKKKEAALNAAQKNDVKTEVLPVIFHKLKNKLTPILGYSQILQMKLKEDQLISKVDKVEKNASELSDLFDELKDSLDTIPVPKFRENLNMIILKQKKLFKDIKKSRIELEMALDESLPYSLFSEGQIGTMVRCIVDNSIASIKMKKKGRGKIGIKTRYKNGEILLSVSDNGKGLVEEERDLMWMPFYSGFPGKKGIGLLMVEKIISNHKGSVSVESVAGEYCELNIKFPVPDEEDVPEKIKKIPARALFVNFMEYEMELFREMFTVKDSIYINGINLEDDSGSESGIAGYDYVIIDVENFREYNSKIINSVLNSNKSAGIYVFYGKNIPEDVVKIFKGRKTTFIDSEFKILKLKNIFIEKILEEE